MKQLTLIWINNYIFFNMFKQSTTVNEIQIRFIRRITSIYNRIIIYNCVRCRNIRQSYCIEYFNKKKKHFFIFFFKIQSHFVHRYYNIMVYMDK